MVFTAAFVVLTVLFIAGVFQDLPEAVLGAIVIHAVSGMIDFSQAHPAVPSPCPRLPARRGAFLGVILIGILAGIVIGVVLSLALLIHRLDHPHSASLGRIPMAPASPISTLRQRRRRRRARCIHLPARRSADLRQRRRCRRRHRGPFAKHRATAADADHRFRVGGGGRHDRCRCPRPAPPVTVGSVVSNWHSPECTAKYTPTWSETDSSMSSVATASFPRWQSPASQSARRHPSRVRQGDFGSARRRI